jgi:hypothetical protein
MEVRRSVVEMKIMSSVEMSKSVGALEVGGRSRLNS